MNPVLDERDFDAIVLAGVRSPGVVTLSGHKRAEKWDVKDGDGQDGASTTRKGKVPAEFTASFRLVYDPVLGLDEFAEWESFLTLLRKPVTGKEPTALDIYHPDLAELSIGAVVVKEISGKQHDGKGGASVIVSFLEYAPPKKKSSKGPSGSKSGSPPSKDAGEDPNDPLVRARKELENSINEGKKAP